MNVQLPVHMDKPSFLAWLAGQEGRYELVEGHVVMMARPARAHARILLNLAIMLRSQLDPRQWEVIAEFGLDAGPETLRYPDIVVDRAGGANGDYTATAPVVLIEVLSPSNTKKQLRDKVKEYFTAGVRVVWVVDPADRSVTVLTSLNQGQPLRETSELDGGDVLPGFKCQVLELFQ